MIEILLAQKADILPIATLVVAMLGTVFALLAFLAARRRPVDEPLGRLEAGALLRQEGDAVRDAIEISSGRLRQEVGQVLAQNQSATITATGEAARSLRDELNASFQRMRLAVSETITQASDHQKERLENIRKALDELVMKQAQTGEQLRATVEGRLDLLRSENAAELEKVRQTVDEKLQTTLETRLGESFTRVVEQLTRVSEGIGEMRVLATNVGDLKNVLTNVKARGMFGEVQLALLIEDFLTADQYLCNAQIKDGSAERVEFAIRFRIGTDGDEMLLPVDAKFPREDYERLLGASEAGDVKLVAHFRAQLHARIRACARDIQAKYIDPPRTTDHGILFLPTEGLYAEVLREPALAESLRREFAVIVAGPTNFAAILSAFQMNFRSLALAKRSSEVWKVLGAVRTEFGKYNDVVTRLGNQLQTASNSVHSLGQRTRAMDRKLRSVETLPEDGSAARLLGLDQALPDTTDDDIYEAGSSRLTSAIGASTATRAAE